MSKEVLEQGVADQQDQTSELLQFVTFLTGDEVFAVDLTTVQEIISPRW